MKGGKMEDNQKTEAAWILPTHCPTCGRTEDCGTVSIRPDELQLTVRFYWRPYDPEGKNADGMGTWEWHKTGIYIPKP